MGSTTSSLLRVASGGPARPPRPHEAPLEIPDLVKPDARPGPPPTKLLSAAPAMVGVTREVKPRSTSWGSWDEGWSTGGGDPQGIGIAVSPPESRLYFPKEMVLGWGPGLEVAVEVETEARVEAGSGPSSLSSLDEVAEPVSRTVSALREEVLERLGDGC